MKLILSVLAFLVLFSCDNKSSLREKVELKNEQIEIKVAAYNVEVSRNATAQEIGEKLKLYNFDIVCFSEVPGGDWTEEAGRVMGLNHVVVGKYSTAGHKDKYKSIASKTPLSEYEEILMADTLHTVTKAITKIGNKNIGVYSVHFPYGWRDQAHIDETTGKITAFVNYLGQLSNDEVPVVMGDFNFIPSNSEKKNMYHELFKSIGFQVSWKDLGIDCTKENTSNTKKPEDEGSGKVIDHIMYKTEQVSALEGQIIEMEKPLSDHKPVWAKLKLK